jgi:hypothetical protein
MLEFSWDKKAQRYRYKDSGRFVGKQAVQSLTQKSVKQSQEAVTVVAWQLIEGKITVAQWEKETASELKKLHSYQYLLGIGGQKQMTNIDYGVLGGEVKNEFKYLRQFSNDLLSGKVSEKQFFARLGMYLDASTGTYEKAKLKAHLRAGFRWERRIRTKEESCAPCIGFAAMGWQQIGSLPNPTEQCDCRSNCGCVKVFSRNNEKPKDYLVRRSFGWLEGK